MFLSPSRKSQQKHLPPSYFYAGPGIGIGGVVVAIMFTLHLIITMIIIKQKYENAINVKVKVL